MKTVHVAGIQIVVGKYNIQRCIICGEAIILDDLSRQMVCEETDKDYKPAYFKTGSLVEIDKKVGGIAKYVSRIGELAENFKVEELPENICLDLLEL